MSAFVPLPDAEPWDDRPSSISLGARHVSSSGASSGSPQNPQMAGMMIPGNVSKTISLLHFGAPWRSRRTAGSVHMPFPVSILVVSPYCAPIMNE